MPCTEPDHAMKGGPKLMPAKQKSEMATIQFQEKHVAAAGASPSVLGICASCCRRWVTGASQWGLYACSSDLSMHDATGVTPPGLRGSNASTWQSSCLLGDDSLAAKKGALRPVPATMQLGVET